MSSVLLSSAHHEAAPTSSNICFVWLCMLGESQGDCSSFSHWGCFGVELEHSPTKSTKICSSLSFFMGSPTCHSCVTTNWKVTFSNYDYCLRSSHEHPHIHSAIVSPRTGSLLQLRATNLSSVLFHFLGGLCLPMDSGYLHCKLLELGGIFAV